MNISESFKLKISLVSTLCLTIIFVSFYQVHFCVQSLITADYMIFNLRIFLQYRDWITCTSALDLLWVW